jgi:hypothetical protein
MSSIPDRLSSNVEVNSNLPVNSHQLWLEWVIHHSELFDSEWVVSLARELRQGVNERMDRVDFTGQLDNAVKSDE